MVSAYRSFVKHGDPAAEPMPPFPHERGGDHDKGNPMGTGIRNGKGTRAATGRGGGMVWPRFSNTSADTKVWVDGAGKDQVVQGWRAEECQLWAGC